MDINNHQEKGKRKPNRSNKNQSSFKMPKGGGFWTNLLSTLIIFLIILSLYSFLSDDSQKPEEIAISQLAQDVSAGLVSKILVKGEDVEITYINGYPDLAEDESEDSDVIATTTVDDGEVVGIVKKTKKESGTAITDTLTNYGVDLKALESVEIKIENPSGFGFYFLNILPFLIPIVFIVFFIWYLSRQVKGAGVQALTFGQSKARFIDPKDKNQRITFANVAGAKEAKEELGEIVEFLKNPKKFLEIGARIPKGVILMGAPGTGKCVTGETIISTNKGPIRIDEIPKFFSVQDDNTVNGLEVISLDPKDTSFKGATASHWFALGEQPTMKIKTDIGLSVEGTHEHPVIVVDEGTGDFIFSRLDNVKKGEWVVVGYGNKIFGNYTKIPHPDVSYLLGVLTGDGCLTIKDKVCFTTADSEILDKVQNISKTFLGKDFSKILSRPYDYELRSTEAKTKLRQWGIEETYAKNKKVPDWVNIAPQEHVKAFIRGLFDTDGSVEKSGTVSFSSSSEKLVEHVHLMLLNLGIVSRVNSRKKKYNNKLHYHLTIYGDFVNSFKKEVGFSLSRKVKLLEKVCARQHNTNVNILPHQHERIKEVWHNALEVTNVTLNREFYSQNLYKNVKRYINQDRMPSMSGMTTTLDRIYDLAPSVKSLPQVQYLKNISSGKFFFAKINGVSKSKEQVFDLTVPHLHNFIGNGLVNHNTLLARAVAGEAGVPFFSISGSEFVEMFVGVGASRVRDLFKMAKKSAPAIIFVDEIDAVGRVRGTGVGGGNDEREQTLNQILVEMDGFEPNEKVIIMAATNRPDVLDPALLRPGRFDRRVRIDLPDREEREAILKIHASKKPLADDVNLRVIAERTPGLSGADLQSIMNEGAITAARESRNKVAQYDLIRSIEKVMIGPERKSHILSDKEKKITAYHEAGHALIGSVLEYADPVHKVSIIARGHAGGYTMMLPIEEKGLIPKKEFLDSVAMSLGGYVVEQMVFDDITTGPSGDLKHATALVRDMVTRYGMSDKVGPIAILNDDPDVYGRTVAGGNSVDMANTVADEIHRILKEGKERAEKVVKDHRKLLDVIANALIEKETLEREEFEQILLANGVTPKKDPRFNTQVKNPDGK
jgi:ATP-dependent metalloprotease FtsH